MKRFFSGFVCGYRSEVFIKLCMSFNNLICYMDFLFFLILEIFTVTGKIIGYLGEELSLSMGINKYRGRYAVLSNTT